MTPSGNSGEPEVFVPIVLTGTEAVAAASACAAVVSSNPALFSPQHPAMQAALKIEDARRKAVADV